MGKMTAASRPSGGLGPQPPQGQPKPQAPSTYPEDMPGSGAGYFGTAPMPHPAKKASRFGRMHAPGKRGR